MIRRAGNDVAVVIPAFDPNAWLVDAVESALAQTLAPAEVIVVDDGGPPGMRELLDPYLDRIVYARRANGGPAAARNLGIRLSSAPLVALLDADDLWDEEKLELQVAYLADHPDCALLSTRVLEFGEGLEPHPRTARAPADLSPVGLLRANPIVASTVVCRREALTGQGLFDEDPRLVAVEDYDLWLRMSRGARLAMLDAPLARYRRHAGSLSSARRFLEGVGLLLDRAASELAHLPRARAAIAARRRRLLLDYAWECLEGGRAAEARRPILAALARAPLSFAAWKLLARGLLAGIGLADRGLGRRTNPLS